MYKYVRKTVVQHKTIKRIKFVDRKQSGFFNTFTTNPLAFFIFTVNLIPLPLEHSLPRIGSSMPIQFQSRPEQRLASLAHFSSFFYGMALFIVGGDFLSIF
jgi:hypothetical protein